MMRCLVALAGALVAVSASAQTALSGPSLVGRYGANKSACAARDYFATVKANSIDLPVFSCTGVTFDQTEAKGGTETYTANARRCTGEGEVSGKPQVFRVVRRQGTIQFLWADGTRSGTLVKC